MNTLPLLIPGPKDGGVGIDSDIKVGRPIVPDLDAETKLARRDEDEDWRTNVWKYHSLYVLYCTPLSVCAREPVCVVAK